MWQPLKRYLRKAELLLYRRKVKDALALNRRGEVRSDGLMLENVHHRLEIRWRARDIHPWDRDLPIYEQQTLFADQALADTEAAIVRLFDRLPQIDVIEIGVLEPTSETVIAEGTVHRSDLIAARPRLLSVGMRLRELGMQYHISAPERRYSDTIPHHRGAVPTP
jgi:hypothetical protein